MSAIFPSGFAVAGVPTADVGSIHSLFEARVRESRTAIAVTCGSESVSYEALDALAEGVAERLRARGVERGEVVVSVGVAGCGHRDVLRGENA